MKIRINYDFFNAIKDVNEGYTPFKVIRNNKTKWIKYNIPVLTGVEYIAFRNDFLKYYPSVLFLHFFLIFGFDLMEYGLIGDKYKQLSTMRLMNLPLQLDSINVKTSFSLLKKAELIDKVYNFKLNEYKIPQLVESKYILVPSLDYKNEIIDTSILQEHVVGSNAYDLSVNAPKKVYKLVYSKI